jgi:cell wall-associated NlpC family hydrolase
MPVIDVLARISEIQTVLVQLKPAAAAAAPPTATTTASATAFAQQLSSVSAPATATSSGGQEIVDAAMKYKGVPYVFGGADSSGMDCSGLVQRVLKDLGIDAPRRASQQATIGAEVKSLADAQPGDLLVTKNADHIVIYAGDGMIIHAPYPGRTVSYQKNYLEDSDLQTIRRISNDAPASSSAAALSSSDIAGIIASAQSSLVNGGVTSSAASNSNLLSLISGAKA